MKILYGIEGRYTDVTYIANLKLVKNGFLYIPKGDVERARTLGDPLFGVVKNLKIDDRVYTDQEDVLIEVEKIENIENLRREWWNNIGKNIKNPVERLNNLQQWIALDFGSWRDEYPEQLMAMKYIKEEDTVLEIGGNIGRNSCIIASILNDDKRLVVLESCDSIANQLKYNREQNFFNFHIEDSALSKVPLIQQGWNTYVSETVPPGYTKVKTITFGEMKEKYQLDFNVLVADCEGALYQILMDEPNLLKNIKTIIIENDFTDITKKEFVDKVFYENGFSVVYSQAGGWGPCSSFFFQVFSKNS